MTVWLTLTLGVFVVILAVIVLGLVLSLRPINAAVATLRAPTTAGHASGVGAITGVTPSGEHVHLATMGRDADLLVAFLDSSPACSDHWLALAAVEPGFSGRGLRTVVLVQAQADVQAFDGVTTLVSKSAWDDYRVAAAPYFVLVAGADGSILAERTASTPEELKAMMHETRANDSPPRLPRRQLLSFGW